MGAGQVQQTLMAAEKGKCELLTSTISIAEVYKIHAKDEEADASDEKIDLLFEQEYIQMVVVDFFVAKEARKLLRTYNPPLKKPFDAIHLATAVRQDCDEFYTFDHDDLLRLDGKIENKNGKRLIIKKPELESGPLFNDK